jgi:hypothetical protein
VNCWKCQRTVSVVAKNVPIMGCSYKALWDKLTPVAGLLCPIKWKQSLVTRYVTNARWEHHASLELAWRSHIRSLVSNMRSKKREKCWQDTRKYVPAVDRKSNWSVVNVIQMTIMVTTVLCKPAFQTIYVSSPQQSCYPALHAKPYIFQNLTLNQFQPVIICTCLPAHWVTYLQNSKNIVCEYTSKSLFLSACPTLSYCSVCYMFDIWAVLDWSQQVADFHYQNVDGADIMFSKQRAYNDLHVHGSVHHHS